MAYLSGDGILSPKDGNFQMGNLAMTQNVNLLYTKQHQGAKVIRVLFYGLFATQSNA